MLYFYKNQERFDVPVPKTVQIDSSYIASPPAQPDGLLYQINRAGALHSFQSEFLVHRDNQYPFSAVVCIIEGKGIIHLEEKYIPFEKGQILLVPSFTSFEYSSDSDHPFSVVWIDFCGGDSVRMVHYLIEHNGLVFSGANFDAVVEICKALMHPPKEHRISWTSRKLYDSLLLLGEMCASIAPPQYETIYEIIDFIYQHLSDNLTLSDVAQKFDYSPTYFSKFFLQHTGEHFSHYLLRQRITRAEQLLMSTNYTVEQIAKMLGFYNASHFIRNFHKLKGISPSRYRKTHFSDIKNDSQTEDSKS